VVDVQKNGIAAAIGEGSSDIVAKFGGVSDSVKITVKPVKLESITVTPASATIPNGYHGKLTVMGQFTDGEDRNGTTYEGTSYVSDNTGVVSVNENGLVTAVGVGTATITVTTTVDDVTKTGTSDITVESAPLDRIEWRPNSITLSTFQETHDVDVIGITTTGLEGNVELDATYSSTDDAIAQVIVTSDDIKIQANLAGTATITATFTDPNDNSIVKTADLNVTVQ
jgi:uncharacterized protein YjdB